MNDKREDEWRQFEKLIDLHKFYFENLIKSASFSFGIIGAFLAYLITAKISISLIGLALWLPFLLSIWTFFIFGFGIWKTRDLSRWVHRYQKRLRIIWRPHAETLFYMSIAFAILFLLVTVGLGALIRNPEMLRPLDQGGMTSAIHRNILGY
jgi:hypothetical protein